jgi:hypothetical protein
MSLCRRGLTPTTTPKITKLAEQQGGFEGPRRRWKVDVHVKVEPHWVQLPKEDLALEAPPSPSGGVFEDASLIPANEIGLVLTLSAPKRF